MKDQVTYPHLLTKNALKMAEGKPAINITEDDWESYFDYCDRKEKVDMIVRGVMKHFSPNEEPF